MTKRLRPAVLAVGLIAATLSSCRENKPLESESDAEAAQASPTPDAAPSPTPFVRARAAQPTEERIAEIARSLTPQLGVFSPPSSDRKAWDSYPVNRAEIIASAERYLAKPIPSLPDDLYLDYGKTGRRPPFETPYRERLDRACALALAECVENRGRFIAPLREIIAEILSERSWVMPAHDGNNGYPVFYGKKMDVDLGAAMRAASLSTITSWLGEPLGPETVGKVQAEIRRRVIDPYLARIYEGQKVCYWVNVTNNWNAVCHAGVVYAALATIPDPETRARVVAGAEAYIVNYLNGFTPDGYCSEGMGYWNYGFGHFVSLAERLSAATSGTVDLYRDPLIAQIVTFPKRLELPPGLYPAFSDNSISAKPAAWILSLMSRRYALAQEPKRTLSPGQHPLGGMLYEVDLTLSPPAVSTSPEAMAGASPLRGYFPEGGVLVSRPNPGATGLSVAMKGGHNDEAHNHNDLGSFFVVSSGFPILVDPGSERYTKRTFSAQRYESAVLNSFGHSVPIVDGRLQGTGRPFQATILATDFSEPKDRFTLDLTQAYPVKSLERLTRSFVYDREKGTSLEIADEMKANSPIPFGTALITFGEMKKKNATTLEFRDKRGGVRVEVDTAGAAWVLTDQIINEDMVDGRKPRRIGIDLEQPTKEATIRCRITPIAASEENLALDPEVMGSPLPPAALRIEAEDYVKESGGMVERISRKGVEKEAIRFWDGENHSLEWTFDVPENGRYWLVLRYASGLPSGSSRTLKIDSAVPTGLEAGFDLAPTGGWGTDATEWKRAVLARNGKPFRISLERGQHTFTLSSPTGGGLNLDWMELVRQDD